jgi:hypothetical protein
MDNNAQTLAAYVQPSARATVVEREIGGRRESDLPYSPIRNLFVAVGPASRLLFTHSSLSVRRPSIRTPGSSRIVLAGG